MGLPAYALAFLSGNLWLQVQARLPDSLYLSLLPLCLLLVVFARPRLSLLACLAAGFLWPQLAAIHYSRQLMPESLAGHAFVVTGTVVGLPQRHDTVQRFDFLVDSVQGAGMPGFRCRLSWYQGRQGVNAGERWRLRVKLKPPHGFVNPGGLDYEQWLYRKGIHATGYVKAAPDNQRLAKAHPWQLDALRQHISHWIQHHSPADFGGLFAALAVGDRSGILPQQWDILRRTGTSHLVAISGLHIGLLAGLGFWLGRRFTPAAWLERWPAQQSGALLGFLLALLYALLAGLSIPTQRALLMVLVVLGGIWFRRPSRPVDTLSLAMLVVLVIDPLAPLDPGFWFSFLAVAMILLAVSGRQHGHKSRRWLRIQLFISLGLLPLTLLLFQQSSLVAPLANLVLIPWVSLLVVPLVLLGTLAFPLLPALAVFLFLLADRAMALVWPLLHGLSQLPFASVSLGVDSIPDTLLAMAGLLLLLAPRGFPLRPAGLLLMAPLVLNRPLAPPAGQFRVAVLDVGQGLSIHVQTHGHNLLFDTGARRGEGYDLGKLAVLPYLHHENVTQLDTLLISHGDNDHIGGAPSVLADEPVVQLLGQGIAALRHQPKHLCHAGQHWRWDGVDFRILNPVGGETEPNNRACVLRISNGDFTALLPADTEKPVERRLLQQAPAALRADLLVAPHHGSHSSSTPDWVAAVRPRWVIVSAGYHNRYGHPAPEVVARYRQLGSRVLNTAYAGMVEVDSRPGERSPLTWRRYTGHYWHHWASTWWSNTSIIWRFRKH